MAWNSSLGKPRTKLGRFIDKNKITQSQLAKWSGVSMNTLTNMCTNANYRVTDMSKRRVVDALNKKGYSCEVESFWT